LLGRARKAARSLAAYSIRPPSRETIPAQPIETAERPVLRRLEFSSNRRPVLFPPDAAEIDPGLGDAELHVAIEKEGDLVEQRIGHAEGELHLLGSKTQSRIVERVVEQHVPIREVRLERGDALIVEPPRRHIFLFQLVEEARQHRRFIDGRGERGQE
jgi:hypothetical protein